MIPHFQKSEYSLTFPWLELSQLLSFLQQSLKDGETKTLRNFRQWVRPLREL